jgi:hypothetical protein
MIVNNGTISACFQSSTGSGVHSLSVECARRRRAERTQAHAVFAALSPQPFGATTTIDTLFALADAHARREWKPV